MDDDTWTAMVNTFVMGCIHGMHVAWQDLEKNAPGQFPPVDDGVMFDAGVLLLATLIEANPEYQDPKRFRKAADMVAEHVKDRLKWVRQVSDAQGEKLLYKHVQAATGSAPVANDPY